MNTGGKTANLTNAEVKDVTEVKDIINLEKQLVDVFNCAAPEAKLVPMDDLPHVQVDEKALPFTQARVKESIQAAGERASGNKDDAGISTCEKDGETGVAPGADLQISDMLRTPYRHMIYSEKAETSIAFGKEELSTPQWRGAAVTLYNHEDVSCVMPGSGFLEAETSAEDAAKSYYFNAARVNFIGEHLLKAAIALHNANADNVDKLSESPSDAELKEAFGNAPAGGYAKLTDNCTPSYSVLRATQNEDASDNEDDTTADNDSEDGEGIAESEEKAGALPSFDIEPPQPPSDDTSMDETPEDDGGIDLGDIPTVEPEQVEPTPDPVQPRPDPTFVPSDNTSTADNTTAVDPQSAKNGCVGSVAAPGAAIPLVLQILAALGIVRRRRRVNV